ncbi:MAG: hypothetical protein JWN64_516 [Parcubacteria group bacterium]|nr:hypothetical protein [Parcubacteria group bacterium]
MTLVLEDTRMRDFSAVPVERTLSPIERLAAELTGLSETRCQLELSRRIELALELQRLTKKCGLYREYYPTIANVLKLGQEEAFLRFKYQARSHFVEFTNSLLKSWRAFWNHLHAARRNEL